jgi:hypothetical protein
MAEHCNNNNSRLVRNWRWFRPAAFTFVSPLGAWFLLLWALWFLMPLEWFDTRTLSILDTSALKLNGFARAIEGRMNFSIMSAAICGAGSVATVLSFFVVKRTLCTFAAVVAVAIALVVGTTLGSLESLYNPTVCDSYTPGTSTVPVKQWRGFRFVVIDNIMCVAERGRPPEMQVLKRTQRMILANTYFGFVGAAAVMAAFAALTLRREDWNSVIRLRRRLDDFHTLTLMASVLFLLNALVTKALVSWTQGILAPDDNTAASFARLGNALLNYWAAQSSAVLLAAIACASLYIQRDVNEAAEVAGVKAASDASAAEAKATLQPANESAPVVIAPNAAGSGEAKADIGNKFSETKWKETNELTFDSATVVTATIGAIAPFLAGPAVDLVTRVLH